MSDASIDPRYPVGTFQRPQQLPLSRDERARFIDTIAAVPARLREAIAGLSDAQLETPYRDGGWTLRQVVHHVADSHMNSYIRTKLALSEERPTINRYDEKSWANMADSVVTPVATSAALVEAVHERWVNLLRALPEEGFARTFVHPERGEMSLDTLLALYAWHGSHHVAHITTTRQRHGW